MNGTRIWANAIPANASAIPLGRNRAMADPHEAHDDHTELHEVAQAHVNGEDKVHPAEKQSGRHGKPHDEAVCLIAHTVDHQ